VKNTSKEVGVIVWSGAGCAIDWLFARNYQEPEPTYILGSEEEEFFTFALPLKRNRLELQEGLHLQALCSF